MNPDAIRELLRRQPFEPFAIHLTNGDRHNVRHPEQVALGNSRLVIVFPETDRLVFSSLLHVLSLETLLAA